MSDVDEAGKAGRPRKVPTQLMSCRDRTASSSTEHDSFPKTCKQCRNLCAVWKCISGVKHHAAPVQLSCPSKGPRSHDIGQQPCKEFDKKRGALGRWRAGRARA